MPSNRRHFLVQATAGAASGLLASTQLALADERPAKKDRTINPELLFATPIENGFTWTLASRLGDMLHLAEDLFGARDASYTILGVEFVADLPRLWFPGNRRHVVVQLHSSAAMDMSRACYQLAHETVHLLSPNGGGAASNLEEGVATYFAGYYMRTQFHQPNWHPELPSYKRALEMLAPRLDQDARCIRRLRGQCLPFSRIPKEALRVEFPELSSADLSFLLATFNRNGG
ncbi:MAG TPA: hypothetical protein VNZ22_03735 [Bacillota bacterium]|nr:hypothetical protein [Bacillota bacterium]